MMYAGVDNTGSLLWQIPKKLKPGTYQLRLESTTDLSNYANTDFDIVESSNKCRSLKDAMLLHVIGDW